MFARVVYAKSAIFLFPKIIFVCTTPLGKRQIAVRGFSAKKNQYCLHETRNSNHTIICIPASLPLHHSPSRVIYLVIRVLGTEKSPTNTRGLPALALIRLLFCPFHIKKPNRRRSPPAACTRRLLRNTMLEFPGRNIFTMIIIIMLCTAMLFFFCFV